MRFGMSVPNAGDPAQLVDLAVTAEEAGWDGFFLWDHLQLDAVRRPPMHDPWVLLGAIAARTSRVRLGTMITPIPRRRPWKLAKEITTLDHLSAGFLLIRGSARCLPKRWCNSSAHLMSALGTTSWPL